MLTLRAMVVFSMLPSTVYAQARLPSSRPVPYRTVRQGCPASVPPATGEALAGSSDFIELQRTSCEAGCPVYKVRVSGDGSIAWTGENFVEAKGTESSSMTSEEARALIQRAPDHGFWALCSSYSLATAGPTIVTTISISTRVRRVQDTGDAAPGWLRAVDLDIDREADTHRWRHGDPDRERFGRDHAIIDVASPKVGVTRLMRVAASRKAATELAEMLADTSLDRDAVDSSGWTALMYAAQAGSTEAVAMLLQARADPSRRSNEGESVMAAAVSSTDDPIGKVRRLWAAGVNVNGADRRRVTPLMIAARYFTAPGLVGTLLQLGADPAKRDVDGRSALDYLQAGNEEHPSPNAYDSINKLLLK